MLISWRVHDGRLFFSAYTEGAHHELWATDGTEDGTVLIADIAEGGLGGSKPQALFSVGDVLLFSAFEPTYGDELYMLFDGLPFKRGDVDGNGAVSGVLDTVRLLDYGFLDGDRPPCSIAADVNGDGAVSALSDAIYLLAYVFDGGAPPRTPGATECGVDPLSGLDCETPPPGCD